MFFFEINNYGTCISTEHNFLGWFLWLKHVNVGVTEIEDVLGVMCLHQMADAHKGVASNFKAQRCSVETDDVPKAPFG